MHVNHTPSPQLLKEVRAALIIQDSSLSAWAAENGVKRQNLSKALVGDWKGPKAQLLVKFAMSQILQGGSK